MTNLFLILLCLFAALAIVVKVAERYGKPLEPEESQRMSKILWVLIGLIMAASAFKMLM